MTERTIRRRLIRRLFRHAAREKENRCPSCGRQKEHFEGMDAGFDVCRPCEWGPRWPH